ncbi:MAG: RNA-guided pseudouridylation complex pseudouridine synthase subunit Cbf5 [Candidatus Heimdallarchaeum aukensis]|uniref:Probable tRNA pseudouridine synthase B n=1 Tax=Candidatus Heimdallarchaeum aukensis TaxID=2876573 RepID=A0A9Y1BJ32_9ARCH|nr:MAG: RNA-guided pseudouridylation complex pseudouridine synthase subunit Cbf5 [Candidatus Heimdallarchaeum aukensis]
MTLIFEPPEIELVDETIPIITLSSETTDYRYGKSPLNRSIEELLNYGIINLDKPPNPTSHEVVSFVKKILEIPRAGHSGTLDPAVTGVLPIALNKATRILDTLLLAGKEYVSIMQVHQDISHDKIKEVMLEYVGEIFQRPPIRASVKRVLRKRKIYELKILEIDDRQVLFKMSCQAGTYVRKFAHDIGQSLGCGAHMKELRRTRTGPFTEETFLSTLHGLYDAFMWYKEEKDEIPLRNIILPMEFAVKHLPKIYVKDNAVDSICHGAPVALPAISKFTSNFKEGDTVAIHSLKNELVALGDAQVDASKLEKMDSGLIVKTKRVLMPTGTYPKQN